MGRPTSYRDRSHFSIGCQEMGFYGNSYYRYGSGYGYGGNSYRSATTYYVQNASNNEWPTLGVSEQAVGDGSGVVITSITASSPAARAGLRVGDVMRTANGYAMQQPGNLRWIVSQSGRSPISLRATSSADGRDYIYTVPSY